MISNATIAVDTIIQTGDPDTLNVTALEQVTTGDSFDGGAGIDTLVVNTVTTGFGNANFRAASVINYEELKFLNTTGFNQAMFNASQFGTGAGVISSAMKITGTAGGVQEVHIHAANNFQAQFTFATWTAGTDWMHFHGAATADTLYGSSTADKLIGGLGNDTYTVNHASDTVIEDAAAGTDTVNASVNHTLADNVENLVITGTTGYSGTGNALNNSLTGNAGGNLLNGLAGSDTMTGGLGSDTYVVDVAGDMIVENTGEGTDTVQSAITYSINGTNLENVTLTTGNTNATGNDVANKLVGSDGTNTLTGNAGNDTLDGGIGADSMIGGAGNDTYYVDNAADVTTEALNGGDDTVVATVSTTLGTDVEFLIISGATAINGTGNALANRLTGNAAANALSGGAGADTLNGGAGADSMTGGADNDTYTVDNAGDVIVEALNEGVDVVTSTVSYTLSSNVDNLILSGSLALTGTGNAIANSIVGSTANNTLVGNAGNDTLDGGTGDDTMTGGTGDDTYVMNVATDVAVELAGEGSDTINAAFTTVLATNFENLTLTGGVAINGTGNSVANYMTGNSAANTLDGSTGNDTMAGGAGNDIYVVDAAGDVIIENASAGTDTVQVGFNYSVAGTNLENITLTAGNTSATGNAAANKLTGSTGNNLLVGDAGDDVLDGGAGADTMEGGVGNDSYVIDNSGDLASEVLSGGIDSVQSSITYSLGVEFEHLTLTGVSAINGTGNVGANRLTGNAAANTLTGGAGVDTIIGGAGADTMAGGTENDLYTVDDAGDLVNEVANEGTDTVTALVSYTLGNNVENLILSGTAAVSGDGNTLNNSIIGSIAANTLNGFAGDDTLNGGTGADTMFGGAGNDKYTVDNVSDQVIEVAAEGTDLVTSTVNFTLGSNVENLTLSGATAVTGTGNALANWIIGSTANNTLVGDAGNDTLDGGTGNDTMTGGAGDDTYVVNVATDSIVEGVAAGTDTIRSAVSMTLAANLENLTLTAFTAVDATGNAENNHLIGSLAGNTLNGLAGNDTLDGSGGADTMTGGSGDDTYYVDNIGDTATELSGQGTDNVFASANHTLSANIENLTQTGGSSIIGTGNDLANTIVGNTGNNLFYAMAGNDTINGGTGADKMYGGVGNDVYYVDSLSDVTYENLSEGTDSVFASANHTLGLNVEDLTLEGAALNGTGNSLANTLTGNGLNNLLDGSAGADDMAGGLGNDIYVVDTGGDLVIEGISSGTDTIRAGFSYTLSSTQEIENLELTGTSVASATGNALNNLLIGNIANNLMQGADGADTMQGGSGHDTLFGGSGADVLTGGAGGDRFRFTSIDDSNSANGIDTITDFAGGVQSILSNGGDRLDVTAIDANTTVGGDQAFVADVDGTMLAGEFMIADLGGSYQLQFHVDDDGVADMLINTMTVAPQLSDFFL